LAFLNQLLCLAVIAVAGYLLLADVRDSASAEQLTGSARQIAGDVTATIASHRMALERLSRQPDVASALQPASPPAVRQQLQDTVVEAFPHARAAYLLAEDGTLLSSSGPLLDSQCLDYISRAISSPSVPPAEFHAPDTAHAHYDLLQPVRQADRTAGFLLVSFASTALGTVLERHAAQAPAYVEIRQPQSDRKTGDVVVASFGERGQANLDRAVTVTLPNTNWSLVYSSTGSAPEFLSGHRVYYALFATLAAASLIGMSFVTYRATLRSIQQDLQSLARIFRDVRSGDVRREYPLTLREFSRAFLYVRDSGRKLVEEQNKLKSLGLIDHLSQLSNRRHLEARLTELFERISAHPPSSVLLIDIDHFKNVNDRHGHDAGDALIIGFAETLRKAVRQTDFLARLGGDEFCVIYPHTAIMQAKELAERLRRELPRELPLTQGLSHKLTWSGGLSEMSSADAKYSDVLWRADQALLKAKETARNTTQLYNHAARLVVPEVPGAENPAPGDSGDRNQPGESPRGSATLPQGSEDTPVSSQRLQHRRA
jgi:diguanylate cyclase (GGDEF)-like protein